MQKINLSHLSRINSSNGNILANNVSVLDSLFSLESAISQRSRHTTTLEACGLELNGNDETSKFIAALEFSNENGTCLAAGSGGRLKLVGSSPIYIRESVDLHNVVVDLSEFTGEIVIERTTSPITYYAGGTDGVCAAIEASSVNSLARGSLVFDGLSAISANPNKTLAEYYNLENAHVIVYTDQVLYNYRGNNKKRIEHLDMKRDGRFETPLLYSFIDPQTSEPIGIEKVEIYPYEPIARTFRLNFDISGNNAPASTVVRVRTSRALVDVNFINGRPISGSNPQFVNLNYCADVKVVARYNWVCRTTATTAYTYAITAQNSLRPIIDLVGANGEGWGATSSNLCYIPTFTGRMSRVDSHEPAYGGIILRDIQIENKGCTFTVLGGDIVGDNVTFTFDGTNSGTIFSGRPDVEPVADGNLILRNVKLKGMNDGSTIPFVSRPALTTGAVMPESTPASTSFFKHIAIDGLTVQDGLRTSIDPASVSSTMKVGRSVRLSRAYGAIDFRPSFTDDVAGYQFEPYSYYIDVSDCELASLNVTDANETFRVQGRFSNVRPTSSALSVKLAAPGNYAFYDSVLTGVNFFQNDGTTQPTKAITVSYTNSTLYKGNNTEFFTGRNTKVSQTITNSIIDIPDTTTANNILSNSRLDSCHFVVGGNPSGLNVSGDLNSSSGTISLYSALLEGQEVSIGIGNPVYGRVYFKMPAVGEKISISGYNNSSSAVLESSLLRATTTTFTVSGGLVLRNIRISRADRVV